MELTQAQVNAIVAQAQAEATTASQEFLARELGGQDQFPCGFAWVNIKVKGNTKLGKMLKAAGVKRSEYHKCFQLWNPSGLYVQNVDTLYAGARQAARVFEQHGIEAYADQRWD
jgi:hypothetical protein